MSVIAIGAAVLQYGINQLGTEAVAAFTAAMRVDQVAVIPLATVGIAMSTYVAQNRGAGEWWRIRFGVFRTSVLAVILAIGLGAVITIFGTDIVRLFVGDGNDHVVAMAHQYLILNGSLYWVLAVLFLLRNALQGLGVTAVPTIAGFMELLARSAVGLLLIDRVGFLGACLAAPLAWLGALLPVAIAWVIHRRRLIRAESSSTSLPGHPQLPTANLRYHRRVTMLMDDVEPLREWSSTRRRRCSEAFRIRRGCRYCDTCSWGSTVSGT